ncbi:serine/threonine-protein kinase [Lysobacter capsici]|uniref:serine/threonine-protein kinase n=1 Tax=Lysobacter capsici TaxID=435897 RepID=UPI00062779D6|nr:serine/threonine-protein kinase [Lysobacter capsici]
MTQQGTLQPGTLLIGRYRIERYLNAGGMQEVYECTDLKLSRRVVAKTPKGGIVDKRFRRGAEMSARINHHNVATTFDYFESPQITFMIEEFVDGVDLGLRLKEEFTHLDPSLAAHVIHNIARALHQAHSNDICHRDLKPSNIMTSPDLSMQSVKLTDFGIAKLAENEIDAEMREFERDESTLTNSNTLLGAIPYMAPECWIDWRAAGKPMDIWALGCIAYQLITGTLPFGSGRQAIMALARLQTGKPIELDYPKSFGRSSANKEIEQSLWNMIVACIQVDESARPTALDIVSKCGNWCYAINMRHRGVITTYGSRYSSGGKGKTGLITDSTNGSTYFYHLSEYYGNGLPTIGERVCVSVYPGQPHNRASPVLPLK